MTVVLVVDCQVIPSCSPHAIVSVVPPVVRPPGPIAEPDDFLVIDPLVGAFAPQPPEDALQPVGCGADGAHVTNDIG